jgi:hypothetical protein
MGAAQEIMSWMTAHRTLLHSARTGKAVLRGPPTAGLVAPVRLGPDRDEDGFFIGVRSRRP